MLDQLFMELFDISSFKQTGGRAWSYARNRQRDVNLAVPASWHEHVLKTLKLDLFTIGSKNLLHSLPPWERCSWLNKKTFLTSPRLSYTLMYWHSLHSLNCGDLEGFELEPSSGFLRPSFEIIFCGQSEDLSVCLLLSLCYLTGLWWASGRSISTPTWITAEFALDFDFVLLCLLFFRSDWMSGWRCLWVSDDGFFQYMIYFLNLVPEAKMVSSIFANSEHKEQATNWQ